MTGRLEAHSLLSAPAVTEAMPMRTAIGLAISSLESADVAAFDPLSEIIMPARDTRLAIACRRVYFCHRGTDVMRHTFS